MLTLRKASERGHFDFGWLKTFHTFSFSEYHDPKHMGFRWLRVINEDVVQPAEGFGTHPHKDMEIVTYVLDGALEHKDSMGNGSIIRPGDVQYMSAGRGVTHSEFNHSKSDLVHLLQIWIMPNEKSAVPRYDQKNFKREEKLNKLRLVVSQDGKQNSVAVRQNVEVYGSILEKGKPLAFEATTGAGLWLQVATGELEVNGQTLKNGDGLAIENERALEIKGLADQSEFLLFNFFDGPPLH